MGRMEGEICKLMRMCFAWKLKIDLLSIWSLEYFSNLVNSPLIRISLAREKD